MAALSENVPDGFLRHRFRILGKIRTPSFLEGSACQIVIALWLSTDGPQRKERRLFLTEIDKETSDDNSTCYVADIPDEPYGWSELGLVSEGCYFPLVGP
jgi:hypothetical protein